MRKVLSLLGLLVLVPCAMAAEGAPKAEVYGGYSFFRADDAVSGYSNRLTSLNLHGWGASVAGNLTDWFGVVGDFSGHYGSPKVFRFQIPGVDTNVHTFMAGPKISFRSGSAFTPFGQALIGATRASAGTFGFGVADHALSAALGGGLDIRVSDSIAIRAIQADYLMTRFFDERQNNIRLSAGIVFRFGTE